MTCVGCGRQNRAGARFCDDCGKPLNAACPACGHQGVPLARFCDACGASLAASATPPAVARKIVTIVFADLVGSTALHERVDAEAAGAFMERYYETMREAVEREGGTVTQFLGDGVKAVFGAPRVAEDDAIRAVRAAVGMQRAFRDLARAQLAVVGKTGLRVSVNTGEVVAASGAEIIGDPVNVAARLQEEARDGDVVIGDPTRRLVGELVTLEPLGSFRVKGRAEPVGAWRVVSLERPPGAPAIPFVGREEELRRLALGFEAARSARRARLAVILGSPGLGKTRLVGELTRRTGDGATVLVARCGSGGATFAPLAEAIGTLVSPEHAGVAGPGRDRVERLLPQTVPDRARVASGIGSLLAGTPAPAEETFFVVRRFLAALAAAKPVILAIDDLQWGEPLLFDLVEHLVQWGADVPLFLLGAARPELRDTRSSLATPGSIASDVLTLGGLDAGSATRLAASVVGAGELPAAIAGRVLAVSEGNPLFVGELVRMLVHDGTLVREGDRWTTAVELASLEMPPTIQALLAARIERLRPEERTVLEHASVVGRQFSRAALAYLLPGETAALDARIEALRRSELIEPDPGWYLGEPALRFHHVLIRDAAYRRLLKGTRAELHARLADWIEARTGEAPEHDETIGGHLEQAHRYRRELGLLDGSARSLGERASRRLSAVGRRALSHDDLPLAASLLGRAVACLEATDPVRADLALDWCEALLSAGEVGEAARALEELGRFTAGSDRLRAWHACFAGQLAALTDPQALRETVSVVAAATETLSAAGDVAGEAKGHSVHALALGRLGRIGASEAALDRALAAARRAHDRRRANAVLAGAPLAALGGPGPVTRASGRCLDVVRVLRITQGAPAVEAVALRCQAVLEALRGRGEPARRMIASARRLVEELGITHRLLETEVFAGWLELLEGDAGAAEVSLRAAYDGLRNLGLGIDAAQAAALLGRALLALGRPAEAEVLSQESQALAGDDLKAAIAWRGVRAEALALRGEHEPAIELARAAVEIASGTDALLDHAEARLALATALRAAGRADEADAEEMKAVELWQAKGATLLLGRASRGVRHPAGEDPARADRAGEPEPRAVPPGRAQTVRRVRLNAATDHAARVDAALAAGDLETLVSLYAESGHVVDHATGASFDREGVRFSYRRLLAATKPTHRYEPLATLGESLALVRNRMSTSGRTGPSFDVGPYEVEQHHVFDVDSEGRSLVHETFPESRLGDAVVRLYERYAERLPEGASRQRAEATAHSVATMLGPFDVEQWAGRFAPDLALADHRTLGTWFADDAETAVRQFRVMPELAEDIELRDDDVLALRPDALLVRRTHSGRERAGGGRYERVFLQIFTFGAGGLVTRMEWFEPDAAEAALARFDSLTGGLEAPRSAAPPAPHPLFADDRETDGVEGGTDGPPPGFDVRAPDRPEPAPRRTPRIENAATRAMERLVGAWNSRDWDGVADFHAAAHRVEDRRRSAQLELSAAENRRNVRLIYDTGARWQDEIVATRGERLALSRVKLSGEGADDAGPWEVEWVAVADVDPRSGRVESVVLFDPDASASAWAELDGRFFAGEAARFPGVAAAMRSFLAAFVNRDWATLGTVFVPGLVVEDHRLLGWDRLLGREPYVEALRSLVDLAPDARLRLDHVRMSARALLWVAAWEGAHEGGSFENPWTIVSEHDASGTVVRFDQYDLDGLEAALGRFAAIRQDPLEVPQNAATRNGNRWQAAYEAEDWEAIRENCAPALLFEDRRRGIRLTVDREGFVANSRVLANGGGGAGLEKTRVEATLLATAGDRLGLSRLRYTAGDGNVLLMEAETLVVTEVDIEGRTVAIVQFDADDRRAAATELRSRFSRSEEARPIPTAFFAFVDAWVAHDAAGVRAALPDDFVFEDRRRTGVGRIEGADAYVASAIAIWEQSPDAALEGLYDVAIGPDTYFGTWRMYGTLRDGGEFETPTVILVRGDGARLVAIELYEPEELDAARARFDALRREAMPAA